MFVYGHSASRPVTGPVSLSQQPVRHLMIYWIRHFKLKRHQICLQRTCQCRFLAAAILLLVLYMERQGVLSGSGPPACPPSAYLGGLGPPSLLHQPTASTSRRSNLITTSVRWMTYSGHLISLVGWHDVMFLLLSQRDINALLHAVSLTRVCHCFLISCTCSVTWFDMTRDRSGCL